MAAAAPSIKRKNGKGSKLPLLLSVLFGVLAAALAFPLLTKKDDSAAVPVVTTMPIVVAARDIPARTVLTEDMLTFASVPMDNVHPQAVTDIQPVVGKVLQYPLVAGEPLLQPKLAEVQDSLGLESQVPAGTRAISVEVNDIRGSAGLINPGDKVDVYAAFEASRTGENMGFLVLQDVTVIAVAQELTPPDPNSVPEDGADPSATDSKGNDRTRTVTLAVQPDQAERLVMSDILGTLRLGLRNSKDSSGFGDGNGTRFCEMVQRDCPFDSTTPNADPNAAPQPIQ